MMTKPSLMTICRTSSRPVSNVLASNPVSVFHTTILPSLPPESTYFLEWTADVASADWCPSLKILLIAIWWYTLAWCPYRGCIARLASPNRPQIARRALGGWVATLWGWSACGESWGLFWSLIFPARLTNKRYLAPYLDTTVGEATHKTILLILDEWVDESTIYGFADFEESTSNCH